MKRTDTLGKPVLLTEVIEMKNEGPGTPGFDWEVSEEAMSDIEFLDHEARMGLVRSNSIIFG